MNPLDSLIIRPGAPGDHARVFKDWLLSHAMSRFARFVTLTDDMRRASQLYWDWQREIIRGALERGELWIASWPEDTTTIIGWCVLERRPDGPGRREHVVHYVYVGEKFRLNGVAKRLLAPMLEERDITYTHRPPVAAHLPIPPGWTFDPRPAVAPRVTKESS